MSTYTKKKFINKKIKIICISNWLAKEARKSKLLKDFFDEVLKDLEKLCNNYQKSNCFFCGVYIHQVTSQLHIYFLNLNQKSLAY